MKASRDIGFIMFVPHAEGGKITSVFYRVCPLLLVPKRRRGYVTWRLFQTGHSSSRDRGAPRSTKLEDGGRAIGHASF